MTEVPLAADVLARAVRAIPDFPKPGIVFRDITPLLADPQLLRQCAEALFKPFAAAGITKVAAIESRGFILGGIIAHLLGAGFVPHRKAGKLPWHTISQSYNLEYGSESIEMHQDAIAEGDVVLIHDDVIATGGTAAAAMRLVQDAGARVAGFSFIVELESLNGRRMLGGHQIHTLLRF